MEELLAVWRNRLQDTEAAITVHKDNPNLAEFCRRLDARRIAYMECIRDLERLMK